MSKNCKIAYHRSTLKECLETEKEISYDALYKLVNSGLYKYYAYDERIKANRYILINIDKNYNLPTWLHHYTTKKIKLITNKKHLSSAFFMFLNTLTNGYL